MFRGLGFRGLPGFVSGVLFFGLPVICVIACQLMKFLLLALDSSLYKPL